MRRKVCCALVALWLGVACAFPLSGCGQKGPLVPPAVAAQKS